MGQEPTPKIDLIKASIDHLIAVSFPKTTSTVYPLAVNVAQGASYYNEMVIDKKLVHLVAFSRTREDAGRACALIRYASGWKGVQFFTGGKLTQNFWNITRVLECYLEAAACNDWTAHCHLIIDDLYSEESKNLGLSMTITLSDKPSFKEAVHIDRYIFPCSFIHGYFRFQKDHPAKPKDQIQAEAVAQNCDFCPYFDPSNYRKIGIKTIYRDAFR